LLITYASLLAHTLIKGTNLIQGFDLHYILLFIIHIFSISLGFDFFAAVVEIGKPFPRLLFFLK